MVAVAEKKGAVSKSGKVRTNINGRIAWVYPDELPQAAPERAAVGAASEPLYAWDGTPVTELEEEYEDYVNARPPREKLRFFPEPIYYWEPTEPGVALQPYPSMGEFASSPAGVWQANNEAQNEAIRERLARTTRMDPDELRLTQRDWDVFNGRASAEQLKALRWCHDPGCHFRSCSPLANNIHEQERGHTTHAKPREV